MAGQVGKLLDCFGYAAKLILAAGRTLAAGVATAGTGATTVAPYAQQPAAVAGATNLGAPRSEGLWFGCAGHTASTAAIAVRLLGT